MNRKKMDDKYDRLYKAFLALKTKEECKAFLDDICTIKELDALSHRLEVAGMLQDPDKTYLDIAAETGASTATISRVNRALNYGSDGYNLVLDRIK